MKGREGKGPPTTDLLVCFPTRAHLTLMPKAICSPVRPPDQGTSHHHHHRRLHHHQMRKSTNRGGGNGGHASPLLWAKSKPNNSDNSEPTSPKVTCAGQIKIKPKPNSCKNWQSVMEEIERIHNRKQKKRPSWIEALGFKKDVMQFLTCLRNISFDFRCFGSFPTTNVTSDDEDDEDEDEDEDDRENISKEEIEENKEDPKAVFSKWFMVFQENNQSKDFLVDEDDDAPCAAPPKNALLLMRCRSAPAKSWLEEKEDEEEEEEEEEKCESEDEYERKEKEEEEEKQRKTEEEQRKTEEEEKLMVMRCGTDFSKFSSDIAKETWVVGGINELLSRSRSWKR